MIYKLFRIKRFNLKFTFRHRFEKDIKLFRQFTSWKIAIWFRREKIVSEKSIKTVDWENVNHYSLGLEFLIFKTWISWDIGGAHGILINKILMNK